MNEEKMEKLLQGYIRTTARFLPFHVDEKVYNLDLSDLRPNTLFFSRLIFGLGAMTLGVHLWYGALGLGTVAFVGLAFAIAYWFPEFPTWKQAGLSTLVACVFLLIAYAL